MKQSNSKKNRAETAFLYLRLSRDDNLEGESYSIQNQQNKLFPSIERRIQLKQQYDDVRKAIRTKAKERKTLQAEKKALSPLHLKRHLELASSIAGLTEEIEELRSEKKRILTRAKCNDEKSIRYLRRYGVPHRSKRSMGHLIMPPVSALV